MCCKRTSQLGLGFQVHNLTAAGMVGTWTDTWIDTSVLPSVTYLITMVFDVNGTGTFSETEDGTPVDSGAFNWSVANDLLTVEVPGGFMEVTAVTTSGMVHYSEDAAWSPASDLSIVNTTTLDGEIWNGDFVKL